MTTNRLSLRLWLAVTAGGSGAANLERLSLQAKRKRESRVVLELAWGTTIENQCSSGFLLPTIVALARHSRSGRDVIPLK
jgi:hypothetical protein